MPVQTTETANVYFPDGAVVALKAEGEGTFTDIGAINSAVTATLNYDVNEVDTANAGKLQKQLKNFTIEGGFTLINLNQEGIERMGGGIFSIENVAGSLVLDANITDQVVASGWSDNTLYDLVIIETSTGTNLRTTAKPTLTSVTLDASGTPEALTENNDYVVVANGNSPSGWSINFISAGMTTPSPTTKDITIDFGDNTPVASSVLYCGTSTATLNAYAMQITHTDSNGLIRRLDLYSVDPNSGGFQFNFKGANEDGVEEMPLTYTAKLDSSRTDGQQLLGWTVENGAA
jgi:hypothetical protein